MALFVCLHSFMRSQGISLLISLSFLSVLNLCLDKLVEVLLWLCLFVCIRS